MLFLKKSSKPMVIIMLLSLAAAWFLDATIHAPSSNITAEGKAVTLSSMSSKPYVTEEPGFWDKVKDWFKKVGRAVKVVYCALTTAPLEWSDECFNW
jgi:hypothetical protein